jgi:hypothetical protein
MRLALTLGLSLLSLPALADEVWTTLAGDIVYESDMPDGTAVLSLPMAAIDGSVVTDARALLFVPGLAGNATERYGLFEAFWTGPDDPNCPATLTPPNGGKPTHSWGRGLVFFDRAAFPSGFTLLTGWCFWDPTFAIRAETTAN